MKKIKHSTGWYTVQDLTNKIKKQRIIIALLLLSLILSVLFGFSGGR